MPHTANAVKTIETESYTGPETLEVQVRTVRPNGQNIKIFEVFDPGNPHLPQFEAGSHIDVHLPDRKMGIRQYSLCGDPSDTRIYTFAVQKEPDGRGGSQSLHDQIRPGSRLTISRPRNNFPLCTTANRHLLLAGGIGITPMISMIKDLQKTGSIFQLHYCTRSEERTAFVDELRPLLESGAAQIHWDHGDPARGLDIPGLLRGQPLGTHLYYCGPPGFMNAVASACQHWARGTVHREYFTPSANDPGKRSPSQFADTLENTGLGHSFDIQITSTGEHLTVPSDKTILQVLREAGFEIETACELGVCGTCRTRYLKGTPLHNDFVLEDKEHEIYLTVCCSRAKGDFLVLDL